MTTRTAGTELELVAIDSDALLILAQRCHSFQLHPNYVVALPQSYLASHQPEGPWPAGATPNDFALDLRKLFPAAKIGAGSLTNFTEFNRCPPIIDNVDFVTFGNSAIVHAADDMSVIETLEALPHIFRSARVLAKNRPLRLGLMSIGMRSNPYGAGVAQNANGALLPMAQLDPRQYTAFAAAYAVGVLSAAALGGVSSIALAMPGGPIGAKELSPLGIVILAAAKLVNRTVSVLKHETGTENWVSITDKTGGLAANYGSIPTNIPGFGIVLPLTAAVCAGVVL